jgi:hypothetical protein
MKSYKEYRFKNNPQEKLFVEEFIENHTFFDEEMDLIVFGEKSESMEPRDYLSDRERDIVLSTIQWLGSPVGQEFLDKCGFVPKQEKL